MSDACTLVTGATGAQGGAVARALLASGRRVRALTRNPASPAAAALREAGAGVVGGDLADARALEGHLDGCDAVFGVTNFWEHFAAEVVHGKNLVDACRKARVRHLVLSTLRSALEVTGGEIAVPHVDSKAEIEAYARRSDVPVTFVHVAFYFENFLSFFPPRVSADGIARFGFPQGDTPLSCVSVEDVGPVVRALLDERTQYVGKTVGVVAEDLRGDAIAAVLGEVLGREVRYEHIPRETYAALGFPGAADLAAMFDMNRRFIPSRAADIATTRGIHPGVASFASWARDHRAQLAAVVT